MNTDFDNVNVNAIVERYMKYSLNVNICTQVILVINISVDHIHIFKHIGETNWMLSRACTL